MRNQYARDILPNLLVWFRFKGFIRQTTRNVHGGAILNGRTKIMQNCLVREPAQALLWSKLRMLLFLSVLSVSVLVTAPAAHAQNAAFQWVQQAGGAEHDYGTGIGVDALGNSYVCGSCENPGVFGINTTNRAGGFVAKYNSAGSLQWVRPAGGSASRIVVDATGNCWVTGSTGYETSTTNVGNVVLTNAGNADVFLAKFNNAGDVLWAVRDGGPFGESSEAVAVDPAGNAYIVGTFYYTTFFGTNVLTAFNGGGGASDVFVAKYDANGVLQWARRGGGAGTDRGKAVAVDAAGNCYVAGQFDTLATFGTNTLTAVGPGFYNMFVVKYDSLGHEQRVIQAAAAAYDIGVDGTGNLYVTGAFGGVCSFGSTNLTSRGNDDIFLARYSDAGTVQWVLQAGGTGLDESLGLAVDPSGNCFITGRCSISAIFGSVVLTSVRSEDIFLARYDATGAFQWARRTGGNGADYGEAVAVDTGGNVYLTGYFDDIADFNGTNTITRGRTDVVVAKLPNLPAAVTLVSTGSVWRFLDNGTDAGTAWRQPGFDDTIWSSGPAQFGYGDGDEATVINGGPVGNRFVTSYFRRTFNVADLASIANLALRLLRDDGAVVYLNGVEALRSNMPGGAINFRTLAAATVNVPDETNFFGSAILRSLLVAGQNLLAVEIHQSAISSTDVSFDMELQANILLGGLPPLVSLASPSNNTTFTSADSVALNVQTADSDGTVVRVDYFFGTNAAGSSTSFPFTTLVSNSSPGFYQVTARATDNSGFVSTSAPVNLTILFVNQAPSFSPGPDQTVLEDAGTQAVAGWASGISRGPAAEVGQALTFVVTNDTPALFLLPPAISQAGNLTFTPAPNAFGTSVVTVVLRDDGGTTNGGNDTSAIRTFLIRVVSANDPPVARAGLDQRLECAGVFTLVMLDGSASDDLDGDVLTFAWREGNTLLGTNVQQVIGLSAGVHLITIEITDPSGSASQDTLVITIEDTTPPILVGVPASVVVECNAVPPPATVTAADNCDPSPTVGFSEIRTSGNCPQNYTLTRIWTASDFSGFSVTNLQVITVHDTVAPILTGQGASKTIYCPATPVFTPPTASDNCDANPAITFSDVFTPGANAANYTIQRVWVASDACGNTSASVSQTITVQDITPPEFTCPTNMVVEFTNLNGAVVQFTAMAAEVCDTKLTVTCVPPSGSTFPIGTNTVQCTATDSSGNVTSCEFTVTVLGAHGVLEHINREVVALRATETIKSQARRLERAIDSLTQSVQPALWIDETHLNQIEGKKVFGQHKQAELYLRAWRIREKDSTSEGFVQNFVDRMLKSDRIVAAAAVQEAIVSGADGKKMAGAVNELAKGDREAGQRHFTRAFEHYRSAWLLATRAAL